MGMYKRMTRQQRKFFRYSLILLVLVTFTTLSLGYLGHFPTGSDLKALIKAVRIQDQEVIPWLNDSEGGDK